jgi:Peptidase A4 family
VTGQWTVTTAAASRKATYSSEWVGIDGYSNSSLIQTGTESDYYNGSAHYYAWWEILPAGETLIPSISAHPGDEMTASIKHGTGSSWTITITDTTTGKSFTTTQTYTGPQTSAEWIEEAPTVGGRVATLANYGLASFDPGTVNVNGVNLNPGLAASEGGVMVQKGIQVSTPSNPDGDTDGFNAAYGSTVPAPPPS